MSTDIGNRVRAVRQRENLTVRDLAARAQVSPASISNIETGRFKPRLEVLERIADALAVDVSELLASGPGQTMLVKTLRNAADALSHRRLTTPAEILAATSLLQILSVSLNIAVKETVYPREPVDTSFLDDHTPNDET